MRVRRGIALALPVLLAGGAAPALGAKELPVPRISVLRIEPRGTDILIKRFHLEGALNPELARKIESGLETVIRYDIRLYRQYRWWFDAFQDARTYRVAVTFDPVTREYVVDETLDERPLRRSTTRDFEAVARTLADGEDLAVFHVAEGKPRRNLYVSMRATFDSTYLFAFIPVDARTGWKKSRKFDIPDTPHENPGREPKTP